jgi:hypothetical protein
MSSSILMGLRVFSGAGAGRSVPFHFPISNHHHVGDLCSSASPDFSAPVSGRKSFGPDPDSISRW